ncbi:intraflagellar transport protein 22 homolog [Amphiura filiformis]|uniref:intraflagellar transport protein 22 homolog n=1 Tax=Amphiura filiformis TaxID=82378 RepID=UPI003B2155C0
MLKVKILVVGPCESGKSVISNFLADATEISGGQYNATKGVRILEFESNGSQNGNRSQSTEVELWDCSGDHRYDECWPAFIKDAQGVIIVYNPDQAKHGKELETWYNHFVDNAGLRPDLQCLAFAHHKPNASNTTAVDLPSSMSNGKVKHAWTNLEDDAEGLRREFDAFLTKMISALSQQQNQEELSIIQ